MGTINTVQKGGAVVSHQFGEDATSNIFNKLLLDLFAAGIYQGLTLSISPALNPVVSTGVAFMNTNNTDWADQLGVRVELTTAYEVPGWSTSAPYIVMRYFWAQQANAYPDILCVAAPVAGDIVIGKITSITSTTVFTVDNTQRNQVSYLADAIDLNTGLTSSPSGGTATNLPGSATIWTALNTLFLRLIDLSGVQNGAVVARHLSIGTSTGQLNASLIPVGAILNLPNSLGTTAADFLTTALTNIASLLTSLWNSKVVFGNGSGQVNGTGILVGQEVKATDNTIDVLAADSIPTALAKIIAQVVTDTAAISSLASTVSSQGSAISGLSSALGNTQTKLPIGTILMFDAVGWVDNSTLPGWYACTNANHTGLPALNIPNLESQFISGRSPADYANDQTNGSHVKGNGGVVLGANNLPQHQHGGLSHTHQATAAPVPDHAHSYKDRYYIEAEQVLLSYGLVSGVNYVPNSANKNVGSHSTDNDNTASLFVQDVTASAGAHTPVVTLDNGNLVTTDGGTGLLSTPNAVPLQANIEQYMMIFIKRCS